MKNKLLVAVLASVFAVSAFASTALAVSLDTGASASANASVGLKTQFADIRDRFEFRMKRLQEQTERLQTRLEARFEERIAKVESKFEKKEEKKENHATSTPLFMIEIGGRSNAVMRGAVLSNGTSTLSVKSWGGQWTVNVASTTIINSENHLIYDIHVGDYVGIKGKVSTTSDFTIDARLIRDRTR